MIYPAESYRAAAKREYEEEGRIEIDDAATVSESEDGGAYVQAWVWVGKEELLPPRQPVHCPACAAAGLPAIPAEPCVHMLTDPAFTP